jgi:hypothetical protein
MQMFLSPLGALELTVDSKMQVMNMVCTACVHDRVRRVIGESDNDDISIEDTRH